MNYAVKGLTICTFAAVIAGCASWDTEAYMPEDYQSSYTKVHECKKSTHPTGDYVTTWVSPEGAEAFKAGTRPLPVDTVLVKSQYSDSSCTDQTRFTVMKKGVEGSNEASADWLWQLLDADGQVKECCDGASNGCVGCHTPCAADNYVCTKP